MARPVLELRELVKHYRMGEGEPVRAVDGVSLSIARGELVALYGPSGSGKSTLLMLIAALLRPDSGAVLVDGREVSSLSEDDGARYRLRELGYVDQSLDLLPGARAIENAAMKLWLTDARGAERRVKPLLERLGLGERLRHRPHQLSMGERQRVMLARALSTDPKLVLADEPTGNLDTKNGREVLGLLRELCHERQCSILLVTHDPQAASFADRAHWLRDGQLEDYEPDRVGAAPLPGGEELPGGAVGFSGARLSGGDAPSSDLSLPNGAAG
jgi:putative ABC transport system ATP-binding protein